MVFVYTIIITATHAVYTNVRVPVPTCVNQDVAIFRACEGASFQETKVSSEERKAQVKEYEQERRKRSYNEKWMLDDNNKEESG